jgi:threonyl-tRNA synthetase
MSFPLTTKRHSLAHILAQAIKSLHGAEVQMAIGPDIETGLYYDFDFGEFALLESHLKDIEKKMKNIIKQNQKFVSAPKSVADGRAYLTEQKESYKLEMLEDLAARGETEIGFYENYAQNGTLVFTDMCAGPHVEKTLDIDENSFKVDKIAGAYWRGDATKKMLTRVYVLAFDTREELDTHCKMLEEAKKRDHRILGKKLKLFTLSDLVGSGLPLIQPNGMIIRKGIEEYLWDLHKDRGYCRVCTPHLAKEDLYITSGHAGHYMEDMFSVYGGTSKEKFYVKPMNCPHHMQIFADNQFSYRDMPIRYFEPATVYRDEKTGQLSWLTRVRAITQDDGHLFCRTTQIQEEVSVIVDIIKQFYQTFGLLEGYWVSFSVRDPATPEKYLGGNAVWDLAESSLEEAAKSNSLNYRRIEGEAAFYGPKLDFMFKDAIGREWQLATIQVDFNLPERFDLSFTNEKSEAERPVVIHRAISGSLERFMGIMIEHFAGTFPLWLAPEQIRIIPVGEAFVGYADEVFGILKQAGLRVKLDDSTDGLNKKVRNAEIDHVNYILVVGEQERTDRTVAVRNYKTKEQTSMNVSEFLEKSKKEVQEKSL